MKKKKIVALILAFTMIFSLFSFQIASADDFNEEYQTEMNFLKILELIENDYDATLVITKSEIAIMILNVLYPDVDFSKSSTEGMAFNDVPSSYAYYPYIKACKDLGIVRGDSYNNFEPNKQVTLAEIIAMVVNALGYTYHAEQLGGYPSGYYTIAKQTGILKNISLSLSDIINGGDAVRIIYNALFANTVEMVSVTSDGVELKINYDKNILSDRFSVFEYDGTVIDDGIVCIDGDSVGDGERAVLRNTKTGDVLKAYINGINITSLLGMRVKAYIRNNESEGRYEFLYAVPSKNSKNVVVNAKDIINVNDSYIEYDEDINTSDSEKIKLSEERPVVLFNGVKVIDKTIKELIPADGFVKFIENTGDNVYDLVMIYSFNYSAGAFDSNARNIVVDSVITAEDEEGISCLFNPAVSIDLNDDEYIYTFILNDNYKSLTDLKSGLIVSVAEAPQKIDGKTYYMLAVSDKSVDGTLAYSEGTDRLFINDGEYYDLSTSLTGIKPNYSKNLKSGMSMTLMLDITGKIAYAKTETEATKDYAYIVKAVKKSQGDEFVVVKFFNKKGEMLTLQLSDKAVIDGVRVTGKTADEKLRLINDRPSVATILANAEPTGRPAIVKVSNGMITGIDTDTPNTNLSSGKISDTYVQQSVIQYDEEDAESYDTLKAGFRSPRAVTVRGTSKTVGGKFFITSSSVILNVPEIDTYGLKNMVQYKPFGYSTNYLNSSYPANLNMISLYELPDEDQNYKVLGLSQMFATYSLDIQGYDIDPDTGVAGLVVVRGRRDAYRGGNVSKSIPMSVFIETTEAYDEKLEKTVTKVHYFENGEKMSATIDTDDCYYPYKALIKGCVASDTPHNVAVTALKEGDIIRVTQSGGKLTHIERVLRLSDVNETYGFTEFSTSTSVPYSTSVEGSGSTFPFDMPIPSEDDDRFSVETSNAIGYGYAMKIKGNTAQLAYVKEYKALFSSIDFDDPLSYSKHYYNITNDNITVINIPDDGGELEIEKGSINDIITLEDAEGDVSQASIIMTKFVNYELNHIIVINGIGNL